MRKFLDYEMPRTLLTAFHLLRENDQAVDKLRTTLSRMGDISKRGLSAHLAQHTEIAIMNAAGDARITFRFEAANLGLVPQPERVHQFWFEQPQQAIEFRCVERNGTELPVHIRAASPHFREIVLTLPRPLRPLDSISYEVSFDVAAEFCACQNYSLCPRTITDTLGLSIVSAPGFELVETHVAHESVDGFLHDDPPLVVLSHLGPRTKLSWEARLPRPGDFFRTYWTSSPVANRQ